MSRLFVSVLLFFTTLLRALVPPGFMPDTSSNAISSIPSVVACHHVNPVARALVQAESSEKQSSDKEQSQKTQGTVFCVLQSFSWANILGLAIVLIAALLTPIAFKEVLLACSECLLATSLRLLPPPCRAPPSSLLKRQ